MTHEAHLIHELARRESCGDEFTLLWCRGTSRLWVEIVEGATELARLVPVPADRALDAFYHPYVYASSQLRKARPAVRAVGY